MFVDCLIHSLGGIRTSIFNQSEKYAKSCCKVNNIFHLFYDDQRDLRAGYKALYASE